MTKEYAIQILREMMPKFARCDTDVKRLTAIRMAINSLAERKTGKWIEERTYMECQNCHDIWHYVENQTERFKCCPNCGAKMEGAEE